MGEMYTHPYPSVHQCFETLNWLMNYGTCNDALNTGTLSFGK